jgi:hypothetical protein
MFVMTHNIASTIRVRIPVAYFKSIKEAGPIFSVSGRHDVAVVCFNNPVYYLSENEI